MLQRRSMEHHLGAALPENLQQVIALTNIRKNDAVIVQARLVRNRHLGVHQQGLVVVEHHQGLRLKFTNLTAQFRPNRTARTRHQNALTVQVRAEDIAVNIVVNLATNHAHQVVIARVHQALTHQTGVRAADALHFNLQTAHAVAEGLEVRLRYIRNRDNHLTGARFANRALQLTVGRNHLDTVELSSSLQLVIIENRHGAQLRLLIVQHGIHHHAADKTGTIHDDRFTRQLTHRTTLSIDTLSHAGTRHHNQAERRGNRRHTVRDMRQTNKLINKRETGQHHARAQRRRRGTPRLVKGPVRVHTVINLGSRQTKN